LLAAGLGLSAVVFLTLFVLFGSWGLLPDPLGISTRTASTNRDGLHVSVLLVMKKGVVYFLVENRSKTRVFDLIDWEKILPEFYVIKMVDDLDNSYHVSTLARRVIRDGPYSLRPGDFWIFEEPCKYGFVANARFLLIEMPSPDARSKAVFTFKVPLKEETLDFTPPTDWRGFQENPAEALFKSSDCQAWFSKWKQRKAK
jgi:hypothetical protein